jgi:S-adenosylmethionine hydrolase
VHLAVVDPDVGASRRAVALRTADGRVLVGPDNGLLWPAALACGGVAEAADIARSRFRLEPVSATFHGRDIFAPVSAHLAGGAELADAGDPLDPGELGRFEVQSASIEDGDLLAHVVYVDRFGNVQLDAGHAELGPAELKLGRAVEIDDAGGRRHAAHFVRTFADVAPGELLLYEDAYHRLALAVSHGDAAQLLGAALDDELRIRPT